ncbi:hypothetical protein BDZ97DRAFT_1877194, partial [Flammula alnicola]
TLRLVCREMCFAVEPLALANLSINVNPDISSFHPTMDKLKAYAEHRTRATDYVRTVSIQYHASISNEGSGYRSRLSWGDAYWCLRNRRQSKDLQVVLSAALSELKHMRALSWSVYHDNGIFETVSNLFIGGYLAFGYDFGDIVANCKELVAIVESSPGLVNLSIMTGGFRDSEASDIPTLHAFLPNAMDRLPGMRLKSLSLENVRILLNTTTLYHLRSLESLSIHFNFKYPPSIGTGRFLRYGLRTLGMEGIHLKKANVHILDVEDELLDYLSSYEGDQELIFDSSDSQRKSSTAETDVVATRFFCDVLPNIAGRLEVLHLGGVSQDRWQSSNARFGTQLKELTVSVDIGSPHSLGVEACVKETAAHLPNLLRLKQLQASVTSS